MASCMLRVVVLPLAVLAAASLPSAAALAATGGASADVDAPAAAGAQPYSAPSVLPEPVARVFRVGGSASRGVEGRPLRVRVRIDEEGVPRVSARVVAI